MRFPRFRSALWFAAAVGLLLPLILLACDWMGIYPAGDWLLCIWPSSVMLFALEGVHDSAKIFRIIAVSIAINILAYVTVLSVLWCIAWAFRRWRAALRDGTTI